MSKSEDTGAPLTDAGMTSRPGSPRPRAASRPRASKGSGRGRAVQRGLSVAAILGFSAALITLILDQATKLYSLFVYDLPVKEPVEFAPFINLIVVWNRGISYGLFQQNSEIGRWGLIIISILAAIGLSFWIRRTTAKLLAVSLGLIVGGAIGNDAAYAIWVPGHMWILHRMLGLELRPQVLVIVRATAAAAVAAVPLLLIGSDVGIAVLVLGVALSCALYLVALRLIGELARDDIDFLRGLLARRFSWARR